jgi:hypothetical protein
MDKFPDVYSEILFRTIDEFTNPNTFPDFEITGAWFNNCRKITADLFNMVDGRISRYPSVKDGGCSWGGIILDSFPPPRGSFLHKMLYKKPENWEFFMQPSGLSPQAENLKNLPENYYQTIAEGKDKGFVDTYIHGRIR